MPGSYVKGPFIRKYWTDWYTYTYKWQIVTKGNLFLKRSLFFRNNRASYDIVHLYIHKHKEEENIRCAVYVNRSKRTLRQNRGGGMNNAYICDKCIIKYENASSTAMPFYTIYAVLWRTCIPVPMYRPSSWLMIRYTSRDVMTSSHVIRSITSHYLTYCTVK